MEKRKIDFQDGRGFSIGSVLALFDLQVTAMLKFQVSRSFGSGKKAKNRFRNNFSFFFYLQVTPMLPTELQVNWPFGLGE